MGGWVGGWVDYLDGKVDVPRGVNNVDVVVAPAAVGSSGLDGDAFLPFQIHRVHLGADAVLALFGLGG